MIYLLGSDEHKAHATVISIILATYNCESFFYIKNNHVDWALTYKVVLGGVSGYRCKLLNICPGGVLRKIFAIFIIAAAIKMIVTAGGSL